MKKLLPLLLIPLTLLAGSLLDERPCTNVWAIEGRVLSVNDEGILIMAAHNEKIGMQKPEDGTVVFIYGKFPNAADGDKANYHGCPAGTYRYQSAGNAAKTVRAFILRK